mgnify:CR=1 FL=1
MFLAGEIIKGLRTHSHRQRCALVRVAGQAAGAALRDLKDRYDPDRRLLDLHDKAVRRQ